jgi:hypothetical protein
MLISQNVTSHLFIDEIEFKKMVCYATLNYLIHLVQVQGQNKD